MSKRTEQTLMAQDYHLFHIPETLPKLIVGAHGTFLDYSGLLIPVTEEQARYHAICLQQHMQEVAYGF
ncbi:hypothetical protein [Aeromonas enteropelogenes]|uniref:hypothetical protein n=1 Tax=Aeromonas enteropelogenes TaxID=29489 RepID=UPI003B9EA863